MTIQPINVTRDDVAGSASKSVARSVWRFSLRTLLIVVAFILLVASHLKSTFDLRTARSRIADQAAQLERLREELGLFEIDDRTKAHVVAISSKEPHSYRWRIYLPPRQKEYEICVGGEQIASEGEPDDMYQFQPLRIHDKWRAGRLVGETFTVDVFLRKNLEGEYEWCVRHFMAEMYLPWKSTDSGIIEKPFQLSHAGGFQRLNPNEPIVLLRGRYASDKKSTANQPSAKLSEGIIVWIR